MRVLLVVVPAPIVDKQPYMSENDESMVVQAFIPEASIETFDVDVLRRLPCLNRLELHAIMVALSVKCLAGEFRALIRADGRGLATKACRLIEHIDNGQS